MYSKINSLSRKFASLPVLSLIALSMISFTGTASASRQLFNNFVNPTNNGGYWAGNGTIVSSNGDKERLKCRATYFLDRKTYSLKQNLRCASPSYSISARSLYTTVGNSVKGSWHEETFNIRGNVTGKSRGNKMNLEVKGQHVDASMVIQITKCRQLIKITPINAPIKLIDIRFGRC